MPVSNNDLLKEIRSMGTRFDTVNERLEKLDHRLDNNVSDINNRISHVSESLSAVNNETTKELVALTKRIDALEMNNTKNIDLIIKGIPCVDGENLQSMISAISRVINFNDEQSITSIYRMKSTSTSVVNIRPVIVKFVNQHSRRLFHVKYFAFTKSDCLRLSHIGIGSDNRIFINENLSKQNLDLLRKAKKLKKDGKIAAAYSYDGQVCIYHHSSDKKFDVVLNSEDLNKYE